MMGFLDNIGSKPFIEEEELAEDDLKLVEDIGLLEYLNAINFTKERMFERNSDHKEYNPFMINRFLSYSSDTIMFANEMNLFHTTDVVLQFEFLRRVIRKRKRFEKYQRKSNIPNLELVKEAYKCSTKKALEALGILKETDIEYIKMKLDKGGVR